MVVDSRLESDYCEFFPPWIQRELGDYTTTRHLRTDLERFFLNVAYR